MQYKKLFVRSYARSASNFIVYNTGSIVPGMNIYKSPWWELGKNIDNSVTVSVLRNPKDAIVSDISMSIFDMGYNMDQLVQLDYQRSINTFREYVNLLNKNINNIIPFTFEQVTENPEKTFKVFLQECGYYKEFKFPYTKIEQKTLNNEMMNKKQVFLPSSKHLKIYQEMSNYIDNSDIFKTILDEYDECKSHIYIRQLDFL
jgi:hypothetical protein